MKKLKATVQAIVDQGTYRKAQPVAHVAPSTMAMIKQSGEKNGLTLEDMTELSEEQLYLVVYGKNQRPMPDFEAVSATLTKHSKVTLKMLHEAYRREAGEDAYSYESFCLLFRKWKNANKIVVAQSNLHYWLGQRMEGDYSGDPIPWRDYEGKLHKDQLFLACSSASGALFMYATPDQTRDSWIEAFEKAFVYFGKVFSQLVFDNTTALVKEVNKTGSIVHEAIQVFCRHYNMEPCPCPPKAPRCKAKVEFSVGFVQTQVLALQELKGGFVAKDLADLNVQLAARSDLLNDRKMTRSPLSRNDILKKELVYMGPLPPTPYENGTWHYATVDKRHCVLVLGDGNHRYSAPPDYVGRKVCVRVTKDRIGLYEINSAELICEHVRRTELFGEKTHLLPEHMTQREKYVRMSRSEITEAIVGSGVDRATAEEFSNEAWKDARAGRKICQAALKACKVYKAKSIEWAMKKCIAAQQVNNPHLCKLAKEYESRADLGSSQDEANADYHTPAHGNIRNNYE